MNSGLLMRFMIMQADIVFSIKRICVIGIIREDAKL